MDSEMPAEAVAPPENEPALDLDTLCTLAETARFLKKSPRWVWSALTRRPEEPGSLPHFRIGTSPRFFPDDMAAWVRAGCPPAATFAAWREAQEKRKHRAG